MQVFSHPQKLVPTRINESTVTDNFLQIRNNNFKKNKYVNCSENCLEQFLII